MYGSILCCLFECACSFTQSRGIHLAEWKDTENHHDNSNEEGLPHHLSMHGPHPSGEKVHLDADGNLVWPVLLLYPEHGQTDFIAAFSEHHRCVHVQGMPSTSLVGLIVAMVMTCRLSSNNTHGSPYCYRNNMATVSVAMDTRLYSHLLSRPFPSRFIDHIAVMFSEVAPWDQERKYTPSTVEACWRGIPKHDVIECCPFCTIIADVMNALASLASSDVWQ